jgi:archaellum biogenesis protein FlaJ (TadC family)
MDLSRVQRGERIAIYGGILLAVGVFLSWYHLKVNGAAAGKTGPADLTGWEAHPTMRWFLVAGAVAPLILAWIIANDHALSWPRGQLTSVVAIAAFGLVAYTGVVERPGGTNSLIGLKYGWFIALVGTILMLVGSVIRQNETEIKRKPPGTL